MNIYQRINEVRKEIEYLQKDAKVEGYHAITHDQVTSAVRPEFIKHGIVIVPRLMSGETVETGKSTSKGTPFIRFEGVFDIDFVNMDEPIEIVTATVPAHGEDLGDKAPGKATSYATKTAILKVLSIETGESDESRAAEQIPTYISEQQITKINDLIKERAVEESMFLAYMDVESVDKIQSIHFTKAIISLKQAKGQK